MGTRFPDGLKMGEPAVSTQGPLQGAVQSVVIFPSRFSHVNQPGRRIFRHNWQLRAKKVGWGGAHDFFLRDTPGGPQSR